MNLRIIKIIFSACITLYCFMICLNNLVDYQTNFQFVKSILVMDDLFSGDTHKWRSVNNPALQHFLFIVIVVWEGLMAIFTGIGTFHLIRYYRADSITFNRAKKYTIIGLTLGVCLWFVVFTIAAGEWFLLWQSKYTSTQVTGFLLCCIFLLFLLFVSKNDE